MCKTAGVYYVMPGRSRRYTYVHTSLRTGSAWSCFLLTCVSQKVYEYFGVGVGLGFVLLLLNFAQRSVYGRCVNYVPAFVS
jgi:hypothetical protein